MSTLPVQDDSEQSAENQGDDGHEKFVGKNKIVQPLTRRWFVTTRIKRHEFFLRSPRWFLFPHVLFKTLTQTDNSTAVLSESYLLRLLFLFEKGKARKKSLGRRGEEGANVVEFGGAVGGGEEA